MKAVKAYILLKGSTAIRIKLGLTQLQLATLLDVSKSLISMVENGRRNLPDYARKKIEEMELQLQPGENPAGLAKIVREKTDPSTNARVAKVKEDNALLLSRAQYQWERKTEKRNALQSSMNQLKVLLQGPSYPPTSAARKVLEHQHFLLSRQWRKYDEAVMMKLEGRMEGLKRIVG